VPCLPQSAVHRRLSQLHPVDEIQAEFRLGAPAGEGQLAVHRHDLLVVERGEGRGGDPAVLVVDNRRTLELLDWRPRRDDLDGIVASAWTSEQRLPVRAQEGPHCETWPIRTSEPS